MNERGYGMNDLKNLEVKLDSFDWNTRRDAFLKLIDMVKKGKILFPPPAPRINLHFHTFFSFNAYGYSPLHIIWKAKELGLSMAGSVDFDVLDAINEFQWGSLEVGLPFSSGIETRIYLSQFSDLEFSSPNEPGVAYYMGNGFTRLPEKGSEAENVLSFLKQVAQKRNLKIIEKVNQYLNPVQVDYHKDVLSLTPSNNPTERHIVIAYVQKAETVFTDKDKRALFWSERLEEEISLISQLLQDPPNFFDKVRLKLMKYGGVGYVNPDVGDFPSQEQANKLILNLGALPSFCWLSGYPSGEKDPKFMLDFCLANQIETIFIIPDRIWDIENEIKRESNLKNLYMITQECQKRSVPIFVGTELNKHGQKLVDDFDSKYLDPFTSYFLESAWLLWGHMVLELSSRRGYNSSWAKETLPDRRKRNTFFALLGKNIPADREVIKKIGEKSTPDLIKEFG